MKGAGTIKSVLPKLNRETSSFTVVDGQDWNSSNFFTGIQNFVKNRTVLNQTEGIFANFKRETFGQDAILIYNEVKRAHELKNKFTLMQYVSLPIYEVFFHSPKNPGAALPTEGSETVSTVPVAQAPKFQTPPR